MVKTDLPMDLPMNFSHCSMTWLSSCPRLAPRINNRNSVNMSLCPSLRLLRFRTSVIVPLQYAVQVKCYAKPQGALGGKSKKMKMGSPVEKKVLPVETDPHKLVNFVCGSNILKEGKDIEIKPDSEYPDWLWDLNLDGPKKLEELDPNSKEYWMKVRKAALRRNNLLSKLKPF